MNRTRVPPAQGDMVHQLISRYLVPAPGRSPDRIKQCILDWMRKANSPALFAPPNASAEAIAELRRKARNNVRRLAAKHPTVLAEIMARVKPEDVR